MKAILSLLLVAALAHEMLVTKEYSDYLKKHVSWEVAEYEDNIFRGWTVDEFKEILLTEIPSDGYLPEIEERSNLPSSVDWSQASCDHGPRNQANCGSCWAFATVGMLSDRCCLQGHDHGWLSPQELVSCDPKSHGCRGGWVTWALDYVISKGGLVPEACYPYTAKNGHCPKKCNDGRDFEKARVCNCKGGYILCTTVEKMKTCLQTGPVTAGFGVCRSFINYKSGVYHCDCGGRYLGLHAVLVMGYSDSPSANYYVRNSWGTSWGNKGYFNIGVNECGISGTYPNGNAACLHVEPQSLSLDEILWFFGQQKH